MAEKMTLEQVRDWHRKMEVLLAAAGSLSAGAARHKAAADAIDAHLAQPAQAVDVGAVREVADELGKDGGRLHDEWMHKLTRAIGNAQADGWKVPEGCIPVPRSIVERWASVDAFNAPVGAAMELKTVAAQMLIHADMITAPPQPEE